MHLVRIGRADAGVQERDQERRDHEGRHPVDEPLGHVRFRVIGLLRRERQLLDREEQPDRERQSRERAADAERQPGTAAFRKLDLGTVRADADVERPSIEVEMRNRAHPVDREHRERAERHDHRDLE